MNKLIDKQEVNKNTKGRIVKDLMTSFLIPDIQRRKIEKRGKYWSSKLGWVV